MKDGRSSHYFIDGIRADGSKEEGDIAWPAAVAQSVLDDMKAEHPDWHLELIPLTNTP